MTNGSSLRSLSHGLSRTNAVRQKEKVSSHFTIARGARISDFEREPHSDRGFYWAIAPDNGDFLVNHMKRISVERGGKRLFHESADVVFEKL